MSYSHPYSKTYYSEDLLAILAAAVRHFRATGLNVEYHLFLPKGVDTCFDQAAFCYSPDNLASFAFCAYHGAARLGGDTIIYSVEPYQAVRVNLGGGQVGYACGTPYLPAGTDRLDSGTASTLSHESFESWSDPIPNTGWYNSTYQVEIGDICSYLFMQTVNFDRDPITFKRNTLISITAAPATSDCVAPLKNILSRLLKFGVT